MSYQFLDAYASVLTADSSVVSGVIQRPIVDVGSILSAIPTVSTGNSSISGTVGASVLGTVPVTQGTTPWIIGSVYGNVVGSVAAYQGTSPWVINGSISGTTGSSVIGTVPVTQTTVPWVISSVYGNMAGSVVAFQGGTQVTSLISTVPSSVMVSASIFGQLPGGTAVLGSVATLQGTNPWVVNFQNSSVLAVPQGSVITVFQSSSILAVPVGSVISTSIGSVISVLQSPSIVGTYAEDSAHTTADKGLFVLGVRNDAVASFVGSNLEYGPQATDSAGRVLTKVFAPEESRIEGYNSVVSGSVTTLVAAAGAGLRNYITDIWIANTGASATLVTFRSGGGTSVLGYTIAPAGGGSNLTGLATPIRTLANETFDFQATTSTSVLFATVKGYKAP